MDLNGNWDAASFFEKLAANNNLASNENFVCCRVSGLDGFEEALQQMQSVSSFICISDIADGYTEMNNSPRTRRVKTVFLAQRHAIDDMEARTECMETLRELFRQFLSALILERVKLAQNCIYIDPRISFNEIERYFFSGCACAYFQIAVDIFTDLRFNEDEWTEGFSPSDDYARQIWLTSYDSNGKLATIKLVREVTGLGLKEAKELVESAPCLLISDVSKEYYNELLPKFEEVNAVIEYK
jgi:hypothetical protein